MGSAQHLTNPSYNLIHGNALDELRKLPSDYVDCCITSPPYWALRNYKSPPQIWDAIDGCEHEWSGSQIKSMSGGLGKSTLTSTTANNGYFNDLHFDQSSAFCSKCNAWKGELGLEPTFELYIKHLIQIFDELKRVLKPTGTCWVVMGDTYSGMKIGNTNGTCGRVKQKEGVNTGSFTKQKQGVPEKSLCKIPQRFEIAMIDHGWIERSDIIWYKPNCMPSSAKDRFTVDYEHVFFFVKSPQRYYFETQYEQLQDLQSHFRKAKSFRYRHKRYALGREDERFAFPERNQRSLENVTRHGRIKRCVWKIPTAPYKEAHFATFPPALIEPMIKAGCPVNGLVLDPFCGSATVGLVAAKLARNFVGIEINGDYVEMAKKRLEPYLLQSRLQI